MNRIYNLVQRLKYKVAEEQSLRPQLSEMRVFILSILLLGCSSEVDKETILDKATRICLNSGGIKRISFNKQTTDIECDYGQTTYIPKE
jgi:hypothetical protein